MKTEKFIDRLNDLVDLAKLKAKVKGSIDMQGIVSELIGTAYQADPAMVDSVLLAMGKQPPTRDSLLNQVRKFFPNMNEVAMSDTVLVTIAGNRVSASIIAPDLTHTLDEALSLFTEHLWGDGMDGIDIERAYLRQVVAIQEKAAGTPVRDLYVEFDDNGPTRINGNMGLQAASAEDLADQAGDMKTALREAGNQFLAYRDMHTAKGTPDAIQKAAVNDAMAAACFVAAGDPRDTPQSGYMLGLFPISTDAASFSHAVSTLVENGYERDVAHDAMMAGLFANARDIGICHGWPETAKLYADLDRQDKDLTPLIVNPGAPSAPYVPVPAPEMPAQADSGGSRRLLTPIDVEEAVTLLRADARERSKQGRAFMNQHLDVIEAAFMSGTPSLAAWISAKADIARKSGMSDTANTLTAIVEGIRQHLVDEPVDDPVEAMRRWIGDVAARNKAAGWWTNLRTGEALDRNVGELLMLVVTELAEAFEGHRKSKPGAIIMDDHLPHRRAFEVEIGDVFIRLGDLSGNLVDADGKPYDVPGAIAEKLEYNAQRADHKAENRIKPGGKEL